MTYPTPQNATTFIELMDYSNTVTDNFFIPAILLTIYIMMFIYMISTKEHSIMNVMTYCGLATFSMAFIFKLADLLKDDKILFICITLTALPIIIDIMTDR